MTRQITGHLHRRTVPILLTIYREMLVSQKSAIKAHIPLPGEDLEELMMYLAETSSLPDWKNAAASLFISQGSFGDVHWHIAKQRALDLLELQQEALEIFEDMLDELKTGEFESLCEGLTTKLRTLKRFATIDGR